MKFTARSCSHLNASGARRGLVSQLESLNESRANRLQSTQENLLIRGDNLSSLSKLLPAFSKKIQCAYIDPPYNTGLNFRDYRDNSSHADWLQSLSGRISLIHRLLREDGSLWVSIDDNECHYLKVLLDTIFGRQNFIASICWEKIYTRKNSAKFFSTSHDYILVYAKNREKLKLSTLPRTEEQLSVFKNRDNDKRGAWIDSALHGRNFYSKGSYVVTGPSGRKFSPPQGRYWTVSKEEFHRLDREKRIWWGSEGDCCPRLKRFAPEVRQGIVPATIWTHREVGHNAEAKDEIKALFPEMEKVFITPKPERLLSRILSLASEPGDYVLDAYAGTGTTGAVAHKLGRKWIMMEQGSHCESMIVPRMAKVISGTDKGGVSQDSQWTGGGSFEFLNAPVVSKTAIEGLSPGIQLGVS